MPNKIETITVPFAYTGVPCAIEHDDTTVPVAVQPLVIRPVCYNLGTQEIVAATRAAFSRSDAETKASLFNSLSALLKEQAQ
jgi:hypothetical protein